LVTLRSLLSNEVGKEVLVYLTVVVGAVLVLQDEGDAGEDLGLEPLVVGLWVCFSGI